MGCLLCKFWGAYHEYLGEITLSYNMTALYFIHKRWEDLFTPWGQIFMKPPCQTVTATWHEHWPQTKEILFDKHLTVIEVIFYNNYR